MYNQGSELNNTTGWYETFFRDYDPAIGRFMSVDPMATKYASMSGYHYSGNNPVMINDPTGADYTSWEDEYRAKNYQAECNCYESPQGGGYGTPLASDGSFDHQAFYNNMVSSGNPYAGTHSYATEAWTIMKGISIGIPVAEAMRDTKGYWIDYPLQEAAGDIAVQTRRSRFVAQTQNCSTCLDPSTVGRNAGLSYPGPFNPMTYPDEHGNRRPDYTTVPKSLAEYPAIGHDRRYDNLKISRFWGLVSDTRAIGADWQFVKEELNIALTPYMDPVTKM